MYTFGACAICKKLAMRTLNVISNSLQQLPKNEYTEIMWREIQKLGRQIYLSTAGKGLNCDPRQKDWGKFKKEDPKYSILGLKT